MNTATASPESSVGFFRNIYNNAKDVFNDIEDYPSSVLGIWGVMGVGIVGAAGYFVADGAIAGSAGEIVFGAGTGPIGAKYAQSTGRELLRRVRSKPTHPELEGPKDDLEEVAEIVTNALNRFSINRLMREQGLETDGKPIDEYLESGAQELEDFASGDEQA